MSWFRLPKSLFVNTNLILAFELITYTDLSKALNLHFVLQPIASRATEDMAAFISVVSESWADLSELMSNRTILFGSISHDLRSSITRMQITLELLEDKNCNLINRLKNDLNKMERLIQQALELVKGLDKHPPTEIDLDLLLDNIVKDYKRQQHTIQ